MRTFIIAEAGVNHNGDEELALKLVDAAASCGADAVKFQTFTAEKLVTPLAEKAEYQKRETGSGNQFDMLMKLEMSDSMHRKVMARCDEMGIEFMSTPFDENAADYLLSLGMTRFKIPSGEITNIPYLKYLASRNFPLILSTGMSTLHEVEDAVEAIRAERSRCGYPSDLSKYLTILHCTSNYPTAPDDVNLRAMQTMAEVVGLPIGYSDHTAGITIPVAAVALGATIIEKHFTLSRDLPGPDHKASLEPHELSEMIKQIRMVERSLGNAAKTPTESELPVRQLVRRSVTLARPVAMGEQLTRESLTLLRPGTGIPPSEIDKVVGRFAARDLEKYTTLKWEDLT